MRDQLTRRLDELKAEFQAGERLLAELDTKHANLKGTLLQISGAMQVLQELLAPDSQSSDRNQSAEEPILRRVAVG